VAFVSFRGDSARRKQERLALKHGCNPADDFAIVHLIAPPACAPCSGGDHVGRASSVACQRWRRQHRTWLRAQSFVAEGEDASLDASLPPAVCHPSELLAIIERAQLGADGEFVVTLSDTSGVATRARAFGLNAELLESVDAPPGESIQVSDYRSGVGFLLVTTAAGQLPPAVQTTRLIQGGVQRWQRSGAFIRADRLWAVAHRRHLADR
jgi:hypothetical protein